MIIKKERYGAMSERENDRTENTSEMKYRKEKHKRRNTSKSCIIEFF
jgi:hypothetical protein